MAPAPVKHAGRQPSRGGWPRADRSHNVADTPPARTVRADARRNREAVLDAAREVLAAGGLDAPMEAVARGAGVGVATVYRHFPTKATLVDAVIAAQLRAPDGRRRHRAVGRRAR